MKNLYFILGMILCFSSASNVQAQEKEFLLDGSKRLQVSGFISLIQEFSSYDSDLAISSGGSFGILFNQNFYVGGYGLGMINPGIDLTRDDFDDFSSDFGHGGLLVGGIINTEKAIHFDVNTKVGFGGFRYDGNLSNIEDYDAVFVVNPEAAIEFNFTRFMKAKVGVGYRYVTGFNSSTTNEDILNSPTGSIGIMFGWFGQSKSSRNSEQDQIDKDQIRL